MPLDGAILGEGIYIPRQAARLLGATAQDVLRWTRGSGPVDPLWKAHYQFLDDTAEVSFQDLMDLRIVRALRRGAQRVVAETISSDHPRTSLPAIGAAVAIALRESCGVSTQVMLPYADRLGRFAEWFVQLWAESLGKHGKGTTPVACLGPLDQHSQLQLFMDGPREHLITVVRVGTSPPTPPIDAQLAELAGIGFMAGRPISDFVAAQAHAVPEALTRAGRPVRTIDIPKLDEAALGALLMHFMLETIFAAALLGIDAFDQPAVELAKTLTRQRLSQPD